MVLAFPETAKDPPQIGHYKKAYDSVSWTFLLEVPAKLMELLGRLFSTGVGFVKEIPYL
jgi:hypothetical protein